MAILAGGPSEEARKVLALVGRVRASDRAKRVSEGAGRASEVARRASEPAGRASDFQDFEASRRLLDWRRIKKKKRRPRASNGQQYPLPCRAHFRFPKSVRQGRGYR